MCLRPQPVAPVPEETARLARALTPHGHPYLKMRDVWETFFTDDQFAALYPDHGQPAYAPWRLALVTILQFAEGLSDRQAADAVRLRIDWKYLLGLELTDPGFDYSLLSEFRARLVKGSAAHLLLDTLLTHFQERGLVRARGKQRTDATHVLGAVRQLSRLETAGETLRATLNVLADAAPDWLLAHCDPDWVEGYGHRFEEQRWPRRVGDRETLALTVGADGFRLLEAIYAADAPAWLREVPAVALLREVWLQQYYRETTDAGLCHRWRTADELPPTTQRLLSPYDPAARWGQKRTTQWIGYSVHLTETCETDAPLLITDVQTTPPPVADSAVLPQIQAALAQRDLLPEQQLVDTAYLTGEAVVQSAQEHQVRLVGRDQEDTSWQARADQGFAARDFAVDWDTKTATCPQGKRSVTWRERSVQGRPVIKAQFAQRDCGPCPCRERCTRAVQDGRVLTLSPEAQHRALQETRARMKTAEFHAEYAARAGIEGTISQGTRRCDLRRTRYRGLEKVQLGHLLTAAALNFVRVGQWLCGTPRAQTRQSAFQRLLLVPA